ncbi:MAG: hypothetical protein HOP08_12905 [Cyclobacteriaceae bacterium]|nr:hypothetical protein [Cyclobacteriaceae bacterium]
MKSVFLSNFFIIGIIIELAAVIFYFPAYRSFYYGGGAPFLQIFFGLVYAVGGYLIFKSDVPYFAKLATVYWWIAAIIGWVSFYFISYGVESMRSTQETYLIPERYRGKVMVYYNKPDGDQPSYDGKRIVFKVKEDGTVHTRLLRKNNHYYTNNLNPLFYYLSESGERKLLKLHNDPSLQKDEVALHISRYSFDDGQVIDQEFFVFTLDEMDSYYKNR